MKFIRIKTELKLGNLFKKLNISNSNIKLSLKESDGNFEIFIDLIHMKIKHILYHISLIFKFKYIPRNFDVYTFTKMQEDILRFSFFT